MRATRPILSSAACVFVLWATASCAGRPQVPDPPPGQRHADSREAAVVEVLRAYERALNGGLVDEVLALYDDDAVFMAQHRSPAVGRAAIRTAYEAVFSAIDLDVAFEIDEVEIVSSTHAWARTRSAGRTEVLATGDTVDEANQELFIFTRRDQGPWQISRYIFSTITPPRGGSQ